MGFLRRTARGRDEATPARALALTATVVYAVVGLVVLVALLVWILA